MSTSHSEAWSIHKPSKDPHLTEDIIVLSGLVGLFLWIYVVLPLVFSGS